MVYSNLKSYSGMPNESTALMRVLVDKKYKTAKSTGLQNVPNESTGCQKLQSLPVWICSCKILKYFHVKPMEHHVDGYIIVGHSV